VCASSICVLSCTQCVVSVRARVFTRSMRVRRCLCVCAGSSARSSAAYAYAYLPVPSCEGECTIGKGVWHVPEASEAGVGVATVVAVLAQLVSQALRLPPRPRPHTHVHTHMHARTPTRTPIRRSTRKRIAHARACIHSRKVRTCMYSLAQGDAHPDTSGRSALRRAGRPLRRRRQDPSTYPSFNIIHLSGGAERLGPLACSSRVWKSSTASVSATLAASARCAPPYSVGIAAAAQRSAGRSV
jgi:hypothetical protein